MLSLDALLVVAAIALAGGVHAALRDHVSWLKAPPAFQEYALIVYFSVPLWLVLTAMFGLHRIFERVWTLSSLFVDLLKLHAVGFFALSAAVFFTQTTLNRSLVALFLVCSFVLSYVVRSALGRWQRYQHESGQARTRLLIIGDDAVELAELVRAAKAEPRPPLIVGRLGEPDDTAQYLGRIEALERVLHDHSIDRVIFLPPYNRPAEIEDALAACRTVGVSAEVAVEIAQPTEIAPRLLELYGRPVLSFQPSPKPLDRLALKHAFDWVLAFVLLILLAPVMVAAALAILITMGRPVFFTQTRAGLFGRQFRMLKFRTMVREAEAMKKSLVAQNEMSGPVFKVARDPRITRLGAFLRSTSIDELPQLLNVLLGQMSLVGPRPLPIQEQQAIRGWHRRRLSMKPGITGIWQVSGRSDIDFEEWMRLDQRYVDEWSLTLDLVILLKTIPVVLARRGAR